MLGVFFVFYFLVTCKQISSYNIDINKCRKNNLYYSKYDLPVFTVMDKVKVFNKDKDKLKTGIYFS